MAYWTTRSINGFYIFLSICIFYVSSMPNPQNEQVSLDDILKAAGDDNARYGTNPGNIDQTLLDDVFGNNKNDDGGSGDPDYDNADYTNPNSDVGNPGIEVDSKYDNCTYYEDEGYGYECVPYYNCKDGTIITDGGGLIDVRSGLNPVVKLDPLASKCPGYLEVCCRHEDYIYDPEPTIRPPVVTKAPATQKPVTPKVPPHNTPKPQPDCRFGKSCPYRQRCGRHNKDGLGVRIQNLAGGNTQFGEWPHMCAILNKSKVGDREVNLYVCGASLISPGIVLTGAHCVNTLKDYSKVKVRCGEWDTQKPVEPQKHVDKTAKYISVHPGFDAKTLQNDFALIHLESDFQLTNHINTICLPDPTREFDSYSSQGCVATGWGKDKFGSDGQYQVILKQIEMNTVPDHSCEAKFKTTRLGKHFQLHDSFLCAGGLGGADTCKGDGGGPLVCPSKKSGNYEQYEQAGIVAWGLGCGGDTPGVYADVSKALGFIDWATKCVEGAGTDYYGFGFGERWAKREYCQSEADITRNEQYAAQESEKLSRAQSRSEKRTIRKEMRAFTKKVRKLRNLLPLYKNAISSCSSIGTRDTDCSIKDYDEYNYDDYNTDVDLSANARDSNAAQKEGTGDAVKPGPRLGDIEG